MNNADLIRKFITENPKIRQKKAIARALMEKYPDTFTDLEKTRSHIRGITGSKGEQHRQKNYKDPKLTKFFYSGHEKWANENLNVEAEPWEEPFIIPKSIRQLSIIADLHSVHLDKRMLPLFMRSTKDKEALLINGDLMDNESLTRHMKTHNVVAFEKEVEICRTILSELKKEFNHVYFKAGNHEFWIERYLLNNAREVFRALGIESFSFLRCAELQVHTIHNLKYITYGDLDIIHGHEFAGFGSAKFPSVGLVDKWQSFKHSYSVKILQAHSHRADHTVTRKSKTNEWGEAWVMPAMCKKGASYAPFAGWDNGWATASIEEDGTTKVNLVIV